MNQEKKEQIEWFLSFLNMNFDQASLEEKRDLFMYMPDAYRKLLHPDIAALQPYIWDPESAEKEILSREESLRMLQSTLHRSLNDLKTRFNEAWQVKNENLMDKMGLSETEEFRFLARFRLPMEIGIRIKRAPRRERDRNDRNLWRVYWTEEDLQNSPLELVTTPTGSNESFLFFFYQAIDGIPLNSLGRCLEHDCNKWFLQYGRRKRRFCSDRCRTRKINKDRRDKMKKEGGKAYKLELKKGRERAHASYEKRKKKQINDKVKVGRRPRKKI